jgi:hypothetical protein
MIFAKLREAAGLVFVAGKLKSALAAVLVVLAACLATTVAHAQSDSAAPSRAANSAVQSAIQSNIQNIRDQLQSRRLSGSAAALPLGFSGEPYARATYEDPFEALGYAKRGIVTKAPLKAAPPPSTWIFSAWAQTSYDRERRTGFFGVVSQESTSTSYTQVGGADVVKIGVFTSSDALVLGVLGSYTDTETTLPNSTANPFGVRTTSNTPGGAFYASYINGGFSTDFSFSANYTESTLVAFQGALVLNRLDTDTFNYTGNVQYRFDLPQSWWIEPTVGVQYAETHLNTPGAWMTDGHSTRVQAGARFGTEWTAHTYKVQGTLGGYAYSEVDVDNARPMGTIFVGASERGYLWGKGTGKLNVQWTDKFSTFVEGEVRGRADVLGYGARLAARLSF